MEVSRIVIYTLFSSADLIKKFTGSNELHQVGGISNYSLDRKLRSTCPSVSSSPPLAMSSLTSLPHKLMNYDSLESVRKSPISTLDSSIL